MEEIQTREGLITNASFTDYLIPTALDMPPVETVLVEDPEPDAPYGVKGVGEPPTVVSTAAILAALRDASGRELTRAPVRPGRHRRPLNRGRAGARWRTPTSRAPGAAKRADWVEMRLRWYGQSAFLLTGGMRVLIDPFGQLDGLADRGIVFDYPAIGRGRGGRGPA